MINISQIGLRVVVNPYISIAAGNDRKKNWTERLDAPGILAATHKSFCEHLPLVFKPDHLLITVMQSLALSITREPDKFAKTLGALEDAKKKKIIVYEEDLSAINWDRVFDNFRIAIGQTFGSHVTSQGVCDFSTSCAATKNVSNITLMHAYTPFVEYELQSLCGIPVVHLLGTENDWKMLVTKVERLAMIFNSLDWWFKDLKPVVQEIASLWTKEPNRQFWRDFLSHQDKSGLYSVSGHINAFFPYVLQEDHRSQYVQNPWFAAKPDKKPAQAFTPYENFPNMISSVNFVKKMGDREEKMVAKASLIKIMTVFDNGVMPFCEWEIINEAKKVCAQGWEEVPQQGSVAPVQVAAVAVKVLKVVLPCWHYITIESAERFQAPDKCPQCNEAVESIVDTF